MLSDAHRNLRDATHAEHERLEARLDIFDRIATRPGRRGLVARFHALHVEAEAALAPWLADVPDLEFDRRRRSGHLTWDLAALGGRPNATASSAVAVHSLPEALGRLYVLEGSSLGGRVIRKRVEAGGGDMTGLSFLDPYCEAVGDRWRGFLAVLDAQVRTAQALEDCRAGAVEGFRHAQRRLCDERVDA